ncbi:NUDIX domain-containing protein (plasmid) [Streptomyces sp. NBC_01450]|uniref:NUDIX domain-containing protein n=1 Tax=Streptomyces sp. NBC_01450 TaxID=2903871 RepID=UPI002E3444FA|nr:NUDIX domain-containing protein [Streptomyces sp. NBC_01450]
MTTADLAPGSKESFCDHTSVGVLISSPSGLLVFDRVTPPAGLAPVAGHVDQHGGPEQAARDEVTEEAGLTVTRLHLLLDQWRPNRCRRTPTGPVGHHWWIFQAEASRSLRPSAREVRGWATEHTYYSKRSFLRHAVDPRPELAPVMATPTPGNPPQEVPEPT